MIFCLKFFMSKLKFEPTNNQVGCFIYTDLKVVEKDQINEIKNLLNKYGVLFFKNQNLSPREYINFSSNFGIPANIRCLNLIKILRTFML